MAHSPQEVTFERNDFYRNGYKFRGKVILWLLIVVTVLCVSNYVLATRPPEIQSFAATIDGRFIPIKPLSAPLDNPQMVIRFAGEAAQTAFSLDFVHYQSQLEKMRGYMTKETYAAFLNKTEESNNLDMIKQMQLVSSATLAAPPVITKEGVVAGVYRWKVEAPIMVSMHGRAGTTESLLVTMQIRRAPITDNPNALEIEQFVVEKRAIQ